MVIDQNGKVVLEGAQPIVDDFSKLCNEVP
jgi:hypothetical protein